MKGQETKEICFFNKDLILAQNLIYERCNFTCSSIIPEAESKEYGAGSFSINGKKIIYRVSKTTPTKTGQFVTIWKRNGIGATTPYEEKDDFDFFIICCRKENDLGQFIFPKSVLGKQGIISTQHKSGKRGFRIYPPWDKTNSKQALETQKWQIDYFINILAENTNIIESVKKLLK